MTSAVPRPSEPSLGGASRVLGVTLGLLVCACVIALSGELFGHHWLWPRAQTANVAEAALSESVGDVAWFISQGIDVQAHWSVRARFNEGRPTVLTALEAAVISRRTGVLAYVLGHGGRPASAQAEHAARCLARAVGSSEMVSMIGGTVDEACGAVTLPTGVF